MNKPFHPQPPFAETSPPYEIDGYGWANWQARLIRERRFDDLDIENIAEEIESVGKNEETRAESALRVLILHILKWQHQPSRRSRSWALSITEQRNVYARVLRKNPSLKPHLENIRAEAHSDARIGAARETDLPLKTFPLDPPAWDVILDEPFEYEPE